MNTIARTGIKAEYIAPERVPAFSRRWQRAMSALNTADDQRHLVNATAQDAAERRAAFAAKLIELDTGRHHTNVARLTARQPAHDLPMDYAEPSSGSIVTNGPNTTPTAHSMFAVGPEVAA